MTFYRSLSSALVATVCAGLGACTALPSNVSRNANGASSASTTTFCMGRFLIDVPAGSTLSGGSYKYNFIRIEPVKAMSYDEFEKEVDRNEGNFRSAKNEKIAAKHVASDRSAGRRYENIGCVESRVFYSSH